MVLVFANADQLAKYVKMYIHRENLCHSHQSNILLSSPSLYHFAYLTHGGEHYLITRQAEWLPLIGAVLLPPQSGVTAQAAEVMEVPVLLLSTCILATQDQLRERENSIQPQCELWSEDFGGNG